MKKIICIFIICLFLFSGLSITSAKMIKSNTTLVSEEKTIKVSNEPTIHEINVGKLKAIYDDQAENNIRLEFEPYKLPDINFEFGDLFGFSVDYYIDEGDCADYEEWTVEFKIIGFYYMGEFYPFTDKGYFYLTYKGKIGPYIVKEFYDTFGITDKKQGTLSSEYLYIPSREFTNPAFHYLGGNNEDKPMWKITVNLEYRRGGWLPFPSTVNGLKKNVVATVGDNFKVKYTNTPPIITDINGPQNGLIKEEQTYTFKVVDEDCAYRFAWFNYNDPGRGDYIGLEIKWGDGTITTDTFETSSQIKNHGEGYADPYVVITKNHTWDVQGQYNVQVRARDYYDGHFGDWTDWQTFTVSMPKTKETMPILLANLFERIKNRFSLI
jgi:hypothetical protein